jgi:signal transduction histidine kinase/CheY-like chemotaxis protein
VNENSENCSQYESRIRHLEELGQWFHRAIEIGAGLGDFQASINQGMGTAEILAETRVRLQQLFDFKVIAFMMVDESDHTFNLHDCEPVSLRDYIHSEVQHHIEEGTFAWALNQTRAVLSETRNRHYTLVLHVLATRTRVRGMFVGLLDSKIAEVKEAALSLFSMIFVNTANALESCALYHFVNEQKNNLEIIVSQRTRQLEEAKVEAQVANKAKSQFLANMSHEIRTPLTAILGYTEALRYDNLDKDKQTDALNSIVRAGQHLRDIINDILDLSKIESSQIEVEWIPTDIGPLLCEVADLFGMQARDKGLHFSLDYEFPLPARIITDPTRLKQILINLCANAVKFTDTGQVRVQISYRPESAQMVFVVVDTGIGLTPAQQQAVFEPFTQADATTTRRFGGTGLGLAISRQLAEKLGGTITLVSASGKGCRFTLTISAERGGIDILTAPPGYADVASTGLVTDSANTVPVLSGRVLVAEDNPDNQQLIALYLENAGIEVTIAQNGKCAVELALAGDFDLVLMDMQMPVMDGVEATRLLRTTGYGRPILALTANATAGSQEVSRDAGCDGFLTKPIVREQFYRALSGYLARTGTVEPFRLTDNAEYLTLVQGFVRSLPERFTHMQTMVEQMQWEQLGAVAHQLKGSAGGLGHPELGETAAKIEACVSDQEYMEIPVIMDRLASLVSRAVKSPDIIRGT